MGERKPKPLGLFPSPFVKGDRGGFEILTLPRMLCLLGSIGLGGGRGQSGFNLFGDFVGYAGIGDVGFGVILASGRNIASTFFKY